MKLRRALLIAAVIPALLALPACSGESAESDGKKPEATASEKSTQSPEEKSAAEAKRLGALDGKAIEEVAITGRIAGFDAKKVEAADVEAGRGMEADKKVCQPLASLIGGFTHIPAVSVAHRSLQPGEATNATVGSMWLASHAQDNAIKVMKELRTAVAECPEGFKTLGLTYGKVEGLPAPKLGDEAVGYRITGDIGKQKVPMTYTVVRSGGVIAAFYGVNMLDTEKAAIPEPVIKAQLERLATQTG